MKLWLVLASLGLAAPLGAQSAGKTGAQVLQFAPGARAAALSGAYTAASGDADALFYNPAGVASARHGASFAYETFATDVAFGSLAGFTRMGRASIGASIAYLDAGEVREIVPDPDFGGNTGVATGSSVSASETAARLSVALPLRGGRVRVGASAGIVSIGIAELSENAAVGDVGIQYDVGPVTLAGSARSLGGTIAGSPLPTELRLGAQVPIARRSGVAVTAIADGISRVREGSLGFAGGIEAGMLPSTPARIGAVARVGYDADSHELSGIRFGAGVSLHSIAVDYAYHDFEFWGGVHRIGVRWSLR